MATRDGMIGKRAGKHHWTIWQT